ncbi:hypothetical protein FDA94_02700 [Herbidospora galbida]|uniref:Uncharacterized protein n=1 Tax=Herbidospora galbida TaxID=2575442 RepID=A0A4U3MRW9_9ACTN|nr:hypothetical protein [Herbidospora galbida]TKK91699.1 hypothetical protein FDA94_02700 [Herbidospora galbida]
MMVILRRTAAGAAAGVLAYGLVVVAIAMIAQFGDLNLYWVIFLVYAVVPVGAILTWPALWALRVRPAWRPAAVGLLPVMTGGFLLSEFGEPEPLSLALIVGGSYAVAVLATTPAPGARLTWWRTGAAAARVPLLAPDLAGHRIEVVDVSPGLLHYRVVPAAGPAVEVTIWPPGFGGLEGRIVERHDATVAITAGPDVPETVVETIAATLAPRPHLFQGDSVGKGR